MAHNSEDAVSLNLTITHISEPSELDRLRPRTAKVYLLRFPMAKQSGNINLTDEANEHLATFCKQVNPDSTICVLTSPPIAANLVIALSEVLKFRHWIAVKTTEDTYAHSKGQLPKRHAALLIFTRYSSGLRHTKTRIKYTHCPACGKTSKDYGGKSHVYHEYGTSVSDVWRDIEWKPSQSLELITTRIRDLFGVAPYKELQVVDLAKCQNLIRKEQSQVIALDSPQTPLTGNCVNSNLSKLIQADCLEVLKTIPGNSIDFCFVDLPYNLRKKYYRWKDDLETVEYFDWCDKWLFELYRILKPGRTLAILNIPLWAARHYSYLSSLMNFQDWIVWEALSIPVRKIMPAHYSVICFSKGAPRPLPGLTGQKDLTEATYLLSKKELFCNRKTCVSRRQKEKIKDRVALSNLWHDVYRLMHNSRRVNHPCQLPPLLMRRLYALFTNRGEMILDCCNGAGTSTLVAQQMERRFIGIEKSRRFHNLARRRHLELGSGRPPFDKHTKVPRLKNSLVQRLPRQRYLVSKKELQLDVQRIASKLGRMPTSHDLLIHSEHPIEYFKQYFVSWSEVCAAARVNPNLTG
jgi:DNA modification methylase